MQYAVIIKHPYRDSDYRVDIVEAPEGMEALIHRVVMSRMLGPFEILSITPKVAIRDISDGLEKINRETETHIET